jgi:adenylate cyclase
LRARRLINQFDREALLTAEGLLKQAIAIDPEYAPAYAALAEIHGWFCEWWGGTDADYQAADTASQTALKLAPQIAEAHAARGFILSIAHRYDDAAREFEEAIRLNPNLFEPYYLYARSSFAAGRIEQSADLFLKAGQVQPEDFQSLMLAAQSLKMLGRDEEAKRVGREGVQRAERRLDLNPGDARALSLGSGELSRLGQPERALQWSNRALELHPEDQGVLINSACLRACLGLKDDAIALLEQTFAKGFGKRDWIEQDPDYDSLRDDPRFQALLQKLR